MLSGLVLKNSQIRKKKIKFYINLIQSLSITEVTGVADREVGSPDGRVEPCLILLLKQDATGTTINFFLNLVWKVMRQ